MLWWSTSFVSLAWELCSQTLLLFLIPAFCPFTGSQWFCSHRTGTQHFLPPFYQDSLEGRSVPRRPTKHSFTQWSWCNPVAQMRSSLSGSCHTVLPLPWPRSFCCKGSNEHRISSNQRLCLYLLIFPHTERSKKYLSLLELFFSSILTVARPKCQSSSSPAHLRYWMCN